MGIYNPTQVDWSRPGKIGEVAPNTVRATTVTIGATSLETHSTTEPLIKNTGDLWLELDGANYPRHGWFWRWNGTYWLSPDLSWEITPGNPMTLVYFEFYCNPNLNYFMKSLNSTVFHSVAQTTGNLWSFSFDRRTPANAQTVISNPTTLGNAANTWIRTQTGILTHINIATTTTTAFLLTLSPSGVAGNLFTGIQILYNLARP